LKNKGIIIILIILILVLSFVFVVADNNYFTVTKDGVKVNPIESNDIMVALNWESPIIYGSLALLNLPMVLNPNGKTKDIVSGMEGQLFPQDNPPILYIPFLDETVVGTAIEFDLSDKEQSLVFTDDHFKNLLSGKNEFTIETRFKIKNLESNSKINLLSNRDQYFLSLEMCFISTGFGVQLGYKINAGFYDEYDTLYTINSFDCNPLPKDDFVYVVFGYDKQSLFLKTDDKLQTKYIGYHPINSLTQYNLNILPKRLNSLNGNLIVDEVRIYPRALSLSQIEANYQDMKNGKSFETLHANNIFVGGPVLPTWTIKENLFGKQTGDFVSVIGKTISLNCLANSDCQFGQQCLVEKMTSCPSGSSSCEEAKCVGEPIDSLGIGETYKLYTDDNTCFEVTILDIDTNDNIDFSIKECGEYTLSSIILDKTDNEDLIVSLFPEPSQPSDFMGSMHYNWKKRVVGSSKSITVVNLPMEKKSTTTTQLYEISGTLNIDSTVNDIITQSKGIVGHALSFDGVNDYVEIGDENLVLDNDFTIEMWFNSENLGYLFEKVNMINEIADKNSFIIGQENVNDKPNLIIGWIGKDNQDKQIPWDNKVSIEYTQKIWNHLVVVYDKTNNKLTVYLNDENKGEIDYTSLEFTFGQLAAPFYLGKTANYLGLIDEFKLYDIALSPEQVQANYDSVIDAQGNVKDTAHYTSYNTLVPSMNKECGKWEVDGYWFRESGAFDEMLTTNELDTLCSDGSVCQKGVCVEEEEQTCKSECTSDQFCVQGTCIDGLELNIPKEFTLADDTCMKVTLTKIDNKGTKVVTDDTFDFEISECEAEVTPPTLTLIRENNGDFVAETTIPEGFTPTVGSVHYNWYDGTESNYESITLLNLPLEAELMDISGNSHNTLNLHGVVLQPGITIIDGIIGKGKNLGKVIATSGTEYNYFVDIISNKLSNLNEFTIEFWANIKSTSEGPLFGTPFSSDEKPQDIFEIINNNGQPLLKINLKVGDITISCTGNKPLNVEWNYVNLIYDGTKASVYVNNELYCETNLLTISTPLIFEELYLGHSEIMYINTIKVDSYLKSTVIDEFKLYSRALTPEQIKANYDSVMETTTSDGVITITPKQDALTNAYNHLVVQENKECKDWKVIATLFDENGNEITPQLEATSPFSDYCPNGQCKLGVCLQSVNCIDNSVCEQNSIAKKCLITDIEKADGKEVVCDTSTTTSGCGADYQCNSNNKCVKEGVCVDPMYECLSNTDCTDTTKSYCVNNICAEATAVDTDTPPPDQGQAQSSGGSSSGGSNECMLPQDSAKCHAQKAYTPCVQDKIIYKCLSKCGTSLLFQYDCKGNTPSYAPGCNNKMKDIGEEGVDCGGKCALKCPDYCFNNKKDADEYGIDCGGKKCKPCEEPMIKEAPIITPPITLPTQVIPPVVETPLFDKIKGYWWTLIPFLLLIGLIVFLITRKQHPHEEVIAGIEQPEELRKPFKGAEPPKETREETSMKKDELKDFIKKELSQGKDREEITKNLERIGYNIENINQIFDEELHNALPKEYEQQIRKYVAYYLDKGNTPEEIREKLKAQGWSDNVIDKFLVR